MHKHLLIRTLQGEKTERTPVWLMRQAGRVLSEYRRVRASVSGFVELVKTPDLVAEVTIQPVDILGVDAAIIFSDILVIPEAMGLPYEMNENKGPHFPKTIKDERDLDKLCIPGADSDLRFTIEGIKLTKQALNGRVPVIGFAGAPFTILCYMVDGGGSKTFSKTKEMLYARPDLAHRLLTMITESTIVYLKAQIEAGADAVQVFDSWAGILGPDQYREFSLKYIDKICQAIQGTPKIVFAKGAFFARREIAALDCHAVGLDWTMDIKESIEMVGKKAIQGNLDPCALYASVADIRKMAQRLLNEVGSHPHIANLGHGLYPDTDAEKVKAYVEAIKEYSSVGLAV